MKKIEVLFRPPALAAVEEELKKLGLHYEITQLSANIGKPSVKEIYSGSTYIIDAVPMIKLDVLIEDSNSDRIVNAITDAVAPKEEADLRIAISAVELVFTPAKPMPEAFVARMANRDSSGLGEQEGSLRL